MTPNQVKIIITDVGISGDLADILDPISYYGTSAVTWEQHGQWWGFWQKGYNYKKLALRWFWHQILIDMMHIYRRARRWLESFYGYIGDEQDVG